MELKRNEAIKLLKQGKEEETVKEKIIKRQLYLDLRSRKRDKATLIMLSAIGLIIALYAPQELARIAGIGIVFLCSVLSILV